MAGKILSDARYFEETVKVGNLKKLLDGRSHTGVAGTAERLQAMKWLLAMISKGHDVSQFYPDVVKNVVVKAVELKKLVYIFLLHYTDHDAGCRELALLSINSFQKDMADSNPLIRALALRTMTSVRVHDIIELQLMAIKACSSDSSAYVRKTAAHAIPKLFSMDQQQQESLVEIIQKLLDDSSPNVVGSAMAAFQEVCPQRFDVLHPVFRKLCRTLVEVDEWGQVCIIDVLTRYTRYCFPDPKQQMSEEDSIQALASSINGETAAQDESGLTGMPHSPEQQPGGRIVGTGHKFADGSLTKLPTSAELDDFYGNDSIEVSPPSFLAKATEPSPSAVQTREHEEEKTTLKSAAKSVKDAKPLDSSHTSSGSMVEDHKSLLRACMPLLHSRNSAVVLATASLLWYCGKRSQSAMRKVARGLVRLLKSYREVQFSALNAILPLARERPTVFREHLESFFVNPSDASFIVLLKLDVIGLLIHADNSETVLKELAICCSHNNKDVVAATIRTVGRIASANPVIADQCMNGLMDLVASPHESVVAETVVVTRTLLQQHPQHPSMVANVVGMLDKTNVPAARASIVWIASSFIESLPNQAPDILRRLASSFPREAVQVKTQILNLAIKLYLCFPKLVECNKELAKLGTKMELLLGYVLELAQFDTDYDLRSRAIFLAQLILDSDKKPRRNNQLERLLLSSKPSPVVEKVKSLVAPDSTARFSIGSLSHLVGHTAFNYQPLPSWGIDAHNTSARDPFHSPTDSTFPSKRSTVPVSELLGVPVYDTKSKRASASSGSDSSGSSEYDSTSSSSSESDSDRSSSSSSDSDSSDSDTDNDVEDAVESNTSTGDLLDLMEVTSSDALTSDSLLFASSANIPDEMPVTEGPAVKLHHGNVSGTILPASDLTGLGFQPIVYTLLTPVQSGGLAVDYWFTRKSSVYGTSMKQITFRLTNHKTIPFNSIRMSNAKCGPDQRVVPYPTISSLPGGASVEVGAHFGFGSDSRNSIAFQLVSDRGSCSVSVEVPMGEMLQPPSSGVCGTIAKFDELRAGLTGMTHQSTTFNISDKDGMVNENEAPRTDMKWLADKVVQVGNFERISVDSNRLCFAGALERSTKSASTIVLVNIEIDRSDTEAMSVSLNVHCDDMMVGITMLNSVRDALK